MCYKLVLIYTMLMNVFPGFANSAEEISFELEGDDSVPVLRAQLYNVEGELIEADINLAERLHNNDGEFSFGEYPPAML